MKKTKILNAIRQAIEANAVGKRTTNALELISQAGNPLYVKKKPPYNPDIYIEGYNPKSEFVTGISDLEEYEITEDEFNSVIGLFDDKDIV